ncbi:MAG: hypothetical protein R3B57_07940 [Phycisphaerales bacterium]
MTCPACGARPDLSTPRAPDAPRPRHELFKPIVVLVIGLALIAVYLTGSHAFSTPTILAAIGLQSLLGVAVFVFCTMTWIGADDPMALNLLRLAAIYAATWGALLPVLHLPAAFFMAFSIPFGIFIALHILLLSLELSEAFILAMINAGVYVAAGFVIIAG